MSPKNEFGVDDLIAAYLAKRRWAKAHPDLRDHHGRRYAALADALDADLDGPPKRAPGAEVSMPSWYPGLVAREGGFPASWSELVESDGSALATLFRSIVERLEKLGSPFGGFMEAPRVLHGFHTEHAHKVDVSARDAHPRPNQGHAAAGTLPARPSADERP